MVRALERRRTNPGPLLSIRHGLSYGRLGVVSLYPELAQSGYRCAGSPAHEISQDPVRDDENPEILHMVAKCLAHDRFVAGHTAASPSIYGPPLGSIQRGMDDDLRDSRWQSAEDALHVPARIPPKGTLRRWTSQIPVHWQITVPVSAASRNEACGSRRA